MARSRVYVQRCDYVLVEHRGKLQPSRLHSISGYMDYTNPEVWPEEFGRLVKYCARTKKKVIVSADSNAHSSFWGSADTNNRGLMLEDFILRNNLAVLNTGSCPTYNSRGHETVIDVTLCSPELENRITEWKVNLDFQGPDHHLIEFDLTISKQTVTHQRNLNKGDWLPFQKHLEERDWHPPPRWHQEVLNDKLEDMYKDVEKALNISHPLHKVRNRVRLPDWWNDELKEAKAKVRRLLSCFRLNRREDSFQLLKRARRDYSNLLRRTKRKSWQTFCNDAMDVKRVALLNKIVQNRERKEVGLIKPSDGSFCMTPEESLNCLLDTHFPGSTGLQADKKPTLSELRGRDFYSDKVSFITIDKIRAAIRSFDDMKASGPDDIKPIINICQTQDWSV